MAFEGLLPSGLIYRSRWQARNASSVLSLLRRLLDAHPDRERLAGAAVTRPTQGRCAQVIEPDSDPHMGVGGAKSVGRIESDPAELRDEGFRPGVAGLLLVHAVVAAEIAADIARGNTEAARGRDEDVGEVPTCAALERKGLGGRGCRARGSGIVGHILMQPREHEMQEVEHIATGGVAARGGETGNIRIGSGECGRAQIEARWEPLNHAAHYPLGIKGLDLDSTATASSLNGPSAVNTWVMLPKASSCWSSRQSVETSMRQAPRIGRHGCVGSTAASGSRW